MEDRDPLTMNRTLALSTFKKRVRPNGPKILIMVTKARIGLWVGSAVGIKNKGAYNPVPEDICIVEFHSWLLAFTVGK
jgi:hypothetical protein